MTNVVDGVLGFVSDNAELIMLFCVVLILKVAVDVLCLLSRQLDQLILVTASQSISAED